MTATLTPDDSPLTRPYWDALKQHRLSFQRCTACGHCWLPARSECPRCLQPHWRWEDAHGAARLISWVVYHKAYHPAFAARVPYAVGIVELAEGPRLIAGLDVDGDPESLRIDQPLALGFAATGDYVIPRFLAIPPNRHGSVPDHHD